MIYRILLIVLLISLPAVAEPDAAQMAKRHRDHVIATKLEEDLSLLAELIRSAEDDMIEYRRIHDVDRAEARAKADLAELDNLCATRAALVTKLSTNTNLMTKTSADIDALDRAISAWSPKFAWAAQRTAELRRLKACIHHFEELYDQIYAKLFKIKQGLNYSTIIKEEDNGLPTKPSTPTN